MLNLHPPTTLLIDQSYGAHATQRLLKLYGEKLLIDLGGRFISLNDAVQIMPEFTERGETINTLFSPDNDYQEDNANTCFVSLGLYLRGEGGQLWALEFHDGDIVAIHPDARWNPDSAQYEITKAAGCVMM